MKNLFLIIAAICLLTACKKTTISPTLFGRWELRRLTGGIIGIDSTYKPGNGTVYKLNNDSTYQFYAKGKLTTQGNFHIKMFTPTGTNVTPYQVITFNNGSIDPFSFNGTQLTIGQDFDDGFAATYQKISD
jgi:hypothetical protein